MPRSFSSLGMNGMRSAWPRSRPAQAPWFTKSRPGADVISAVRTVSRGETMIEPSTIATLIGRSRERTYQAGRVSARERQVLRMMAEGLPSPEIATKLGISYSTVRTHIRSLGSKLEVHSKLAVIVKARQLALIVD